MKPTEEQIKEFWLRCGFRPYLDKNYFDQPPRTLNGWIRDGSPPELFLPPIDLNNLFKYAVPKVYDMELTKRNRFEGEWQTAYRVRVRLARKEWLPPVTDKDPALALFWALWEVLK